MPYVEEAVRILAEVLDALAYANSRGVIHRDIKSDNVMLTGRRRRASNAGTRRRAALLRPGGSPRLMVRFDEPSREWHRFGFQARRGGLYFTVGERRSDVWAAEIKAGR